jgi:predicted XRE-type DNA-binding protein
MSAKRFARVWDAIEETPEQAENMRLRADLIVALNRFIAGQRMSQLEAAKHFGISQPRVSDLARGKINLFSLDSLVNMAAAAGLRIDLRVRKAA